MNNRELFKKITEKWPVKILSLAAALLISLFYKMSTLETRSFSSPLRIETANTLIPASSYPQSVKIKLRGENNGVSAIQEDDLEAYVDLNKYSSEGSFRIPVQIRKKGSALGVEPLEITVEPVDIHVRLENKTSRVVDITPSFRGFLAEGYEMTNQAFFPSSVTVEGPRSNVQALTELNTAPIELEGRDKDFRVIITIINNDPLITIHGTRTVEYQGAIRQITGEAKQDDGDETQ